MWCLDKLRFVLVSSSSHFLFLSFLFSLSLPPSLKENLEMKLTELCFTLLWCNVCEVSHIVYMFPWNKDGTFIEHVSWISSQNQNWKWGLEIMLNIFYVYFVMKIILCQNWPCINREEEYIFALLPSTPLCIILVHILVRFARFYS